MLHKEMGAFLIAVGTQMMQNNVSVGDVIDNVDNDKILAASMMSNGLDGETADKIAKGAGFAALRSLSTVPTFATPEAQASYLESDDDEWDEDDGETSFDSFPLSREEVTKIVEKEIKNFFGGDAALVRMKHYNLTLGELAEAPDEVEDFIVVLDEELDLESIQVDWPKLTLDKLIDALTQDN